MTKESERFAVFLCVQVRTRCLSGKEVSAKPSLVLCQTQITGLKRQLPLVSGLLFAKLD